MMKRILSCLSLMLPFVISCNNDEPEIKTFHSIVDVSATDEYAEDKYSIVTMYSTDGGATFVDFPVVKEGETYKAMVVHRDGGDFQIISTTCFAVDWSGSTPAPNSVEGGVAEFTLQKDNSLAAKVTNTYYTPFVPSKWVGAWSGEEDGDCCSSVDENNIRQDTSDPNKFIMDNFWGDHVDAYMIFTPSTNKDTQIVTIPEQETSEGGIARGVGTYDQCTNTFMIATEYEIGGDTYVFDYWFSKH